MKRTKVDLRVKYKFETADRFTYNRKGGYNYNGKYKPGYTEWLEEQLLESLETYDEIQIKKLEAIEDLKRLEEQVEYYSNMR